MNDKQWEEYMEEVKSKLPVNQQLKDELRQSLIKQRGRRGFRYWKPVSLVSALLAVVIFSMVWLGSPSVQKIEASSLHFNQSFSLLEQLGEEISSGIAEYKGVIYVPMQEKGLYKYDHKSYSKLIDGNITFTRVSPDGTKLVYVQDGSLYLFYIKNNISELLLEKASADEPLSAPAWSEAGTHILFARAGEVAEISLKAKTVNPIAEGAYPAYLDGRKKVIFERDGQIIERVLSSGNEQVRTSGKYPAVSPDGSYIAFIQTDEAAQMEDVWIADSDWQTRKQVSRNQMSDAWDRKTGEMIEGKQQPKYTFEEPVWSSDSDRLMLYKVFHTNVVWKKLTQFSVSEKPASPEEVVAGSIEALIYRDEDFAHSFFSYDPGYLKGTSPRQVGYRILGSGMENGKRYVDAETYLSYQDPYYQIDTTRYLLSETDRGYLIDEMVEISSQVVQLSAEGVELITGDGAGEMLFALPSIPSEEGWNNGEVHSLVYMTETRTLYFTMDRKQGDRHKLMLFKYERDSGKFEELIELGAEQHSSLMIADPGQTYIAVEMEVNGRNDVVVYDAEKRSLTKMSEHVLGEQPLELHTRFWKEGELTYYAAMDNRDVFFRYKPMSK